MFSWGGSKSGLSLVFPSAEVSPARNKGQPTRRRNCFVREKEFVNIFPSILVALITTRLFPTSEQPFTFWCYPFWRTSRFQLAYIRCFHSEMRIQLQLGFKLHPASLAVDWHLMTSINVLPEKISVKYEKEIWGDCGSLLYSGNGLPM